MNTAPSDSQRRSLSRTLPVAVLLFTVVPLVIAGLLALTESAQRLRSEQERHGRQTAELLAGRVQLMLESGERLAAMIASAPATATALVAGAEDSVDDLGSEWVLLMRSHPQVDRVALLDVTGRLVQSNPPEPTTMRPPGAPPYAPTRWVPRGSSGSIDVFVPVPSGPDSSTLLGWVAVGLSPTAIARTLALPADNPGETRAALFTPSGRALTLVIRKPDAAFTVLPVPVVESLPKPGRRAPTLQAVAKVEPGDWSVEVTQSLDGFRDQVLEELLRFGAVVLVISLFSALLAWRFAHGLAQAIRDVARSARAILRGHYLNAHVELRRDDELGLLARSFNHMSWELEKRERERDVFGRLVSPEVRDQLLQGELMLGGQEVEVTVLLTDIRGFTTLCETLKPRDIVLMLNEYFTRMTEAAQRYGGYVNNFMGDAMVVVFGAPQPDPHRVLRSLYAAVEMQAALDEFNLERSAYASTPIVMGIGLASGTALAGQIGSPERCIYTVIGDTVNVASRIESLGKVHSDMVAFVNQETYELLPAELRSLLVPLGPVQLKGRDRLVEVYALPRGVAMPAPPAHLLKQAQAEEIL